MDEVLVKIITWEEVTEEELNKFFWIEPKEEKEEQKEEDKSWAGCSGFPERVVAHMNKFRIKYNWKFKDSETFWDMFFEELKNIL